MSARRPSGLTTVQGGGAVDVPEPAVVQTAWARVFMAALGRAGVRTLVVSPGSRSTPFVLAAEHAGLSTRVIIDERSAAFFALGCARASGEPVALLCTSGTAGAHYYPALIEAAESYVPLVAITADRPPELQGCAAPQTIDQTHLFGRWVRLFTDLGPPEAARASLRAVARKAVQAVRAATWPVPGPVHVNAPARKPLEPMRPRTPADLQLERRADQVLATLHTQAVAPASRAPDDTIDALASALAAARCGLIVAGPVSPAAARAGDVTLAEAGERLARVTGFPLLAEAASQLRFAGAARSGEPLHIDAFDAILGLERFRRAHPAEVIVHIGAPPTSGAWASFLAENAECVQVVIAEHGWNDPQSSADMLVLASPVDTVSRLAAAVEARRAGSADSPASWAHRFIAANRAAWLAVEEILGAEPMSEGQAMRAIVASLPRGALLSLGNSLPIRTVDTYCRAGAATVDVLSQRGVNGIDGLISSAAGAAWAARSERRAVVAVIGDVSFTHDVGGLLAAARSRTPLVIVVIDNDGGRIFEQLPVARADYGTSAELFDTHWLTRPRCDIAAAAQMAGVAHAVARTPAELAAHVRDACGRAGCTVVRAVVEPASASRDRERLLAALDARLTAELVDIGRAEERP